MTEWPLLGNSLTECISIHFHVLWRLWHNPLIHRCFPKLSFCDLGHFSNYLPWECAVREIIVAGTHKFLFLDLFTFPFSQILILILFPKYWYFTEEEDLDEAFQWKLYFPFFLKYWCIIFLLFPSYPHFSLCLFLSCRFSFYDKMIQSHIVCWQWMLCAQHIPLGSRNSLLLLRDIGSWWLTTQFLFQNCPQLKEATLPKIMFHPGDSLHPKRPRYFVSVWNNSEGPSQFLSSSWDQLRLLLQLHHGLPSPFACPAFLTLHKYYSWQHPQIKLLNDSLRISESVSQEPDLWHK